MKHASDCVAVLLKELKKLSNDNKCRVLVACDFVNNFYYKTALRHPNKRDVAVDHLTVGRAFKKLFINDWVRTHIRSSAICNYSNLTSVCLPLIVYQKNGAVVVVVDNWPYFNKNHGEWRWKDKPDLPKYLLTEQVINLANREALKSAADIYYSHYLSLLQGFEDFDPFIPIKVSTYTDKEMESCLDFYTEKGLLQRAASRTASGRDEIKFLSASSALELYKLSTAW